jgi:hypothetical protein
VADTTRNCFALVDCGINPIQGLFTSISSTSTFNKAKIATVEIKSVRRLTSGSRTRADEAITNFMGQWSRKSTFSHRKEKKREKETLGAEPE